MTERPGSSTTASAGRDLRAAIALGVVLAGTFIGTVLWSTVAFAALVLVLVAIGTFEAGTVLGSLGKPVDRSAAVVGGCAVVVGAAAAGAPGQVVGLLVLVLGAFGAALADSARRDVTRRLAHTILLGSWVGFLASFAVLLHARPDGTVAVLGVIGAAVFGDIGAYAVGRLVGRTRIAPSVSPNKTLEGLLGGIALAAALAVLVLPRLGQGITPPAALALAVLASSAGFLGDLVESMVKRDLGVKDLGSVLPGHGGVLDRVDAILLALPVGWLALELLARG